MNTILYPEDIIAVIDSFLACNEGDEATEHLLIDVGAELLDVSQDAMMELCSSHK